MIPTTTLTPSPNPQNVNHMLNKPALIRRWKQFHPLLPRQHHNGLLAHAEEGPAILQNMGLRLPHQLLFLRCASFLALGGMRGVHGVHELVLGQHPLTYRLLDPLPFLRHALFLALEAMRGVHGVHEIVRGHYPPIS